MKRRRTLPTVVVALAALVGGSVSASIAVGASTPPVGELSWSSVSSGALHSCGVESGRLFCWGDNDFGQLGNGGTKRSATPKQVGTDSNWAQVAAGKGHTCAVKVERSLWCWGDNDEGQLGIGSFENQDAPVQVHAGDDDQWVEVSAGAFHTCSRNVRHAVWCWGRGAEGQLGNGSTDAQATPVRVSQGWVGVTAGAYHTCGLRQTAPIRDVTMRCWGANGDGQLGVGDTDNRYVPTPVRHLKKWLQVSAGGAHTCAVRSGGVGYCWGNNDDGQLGDGSTDSWLVPHRFGIDLDWETLSAGGSHTCGTTSNQRLWCWGLNDHGQLGDGTTTDHGLPGRVIDAPRGWSRVSGGGSHTCGFHLNGGLRCWGYNAEGQVGDGTHQDRHRPVLVRPPPP